MQSFDSSNFSQSDAKDKVEARKATNAAEEMEFFFFSFKVNLEKAPWDTTCEDQEISHIGWFSG